MIKLIYKIDLEDKAAELEWLSHHRIYPAIDYHYDWEARKTCVIVGMIISNEAATVIKLRHPIKFQSTYKQQ